MNQYIVFAFLLCIAVVNATSYATSTSYANSACTGAITGQTAYPLNVCIPSSTGSAQNTYTAGSSYFTQNLYTTSSCTGTSISQTQNFSSCNSGSQWVYSSSTPVLNGFGSASSTTCGSTGINTGYNVIAYGQCTSYGTSSQSVKYYGGAQCVLYNYNGASCSGTPTSSYAQSTNECDDGLTTGCYVNGALLPLQKIGYTYSSSTQVLVTKNYPITTTCSGYSDTTNYARVATCDGLGNQQTIVGNQVITSSYDNFNCTGYQYASASETTTIGQCQNYPDGSSDIVTLGSFPHSVNAPTVVYQSSCGANPTIYAADVFTTGCQVNGTYSASTTCGTLANGTISFTTNVYKNQACTGTPFLTLYDDGPSCTQVTPTVAARFTCSATFSPSSSASTITAFSVVILAVVAVFFM